MGYEITSGIINSAHKLVFYGPEGIGKTTFLSHLPDPVFIDTEGSTKKLNVRRLPKPTSWQMLIDEVKFVMQTRPCKSLVIDTADWAERLCTEAVCAAYGKNGIEDFGYGNGYTYVGEEWGRFLNLLQDVVDTTGIHVALSCHAIVRKFEQPNEMGAYDRYELKLGKKTTSQTAPITKEWADTILFANYKTFSVASDDKGKKFKAQGGQRVMYTVHHPCWDAKNRDNLKEELPLDYNEVAHLFSGQPQTQAVQTAPVFDIQQPIEQQPMKTFEPEPLDSIVMPSSIEETTAGHSVNDGIPKALMDLMNSNHVYEDEIREVCAQKGYYPVDTPISNYDPGFIDGVLVGAWNQVFNEIIKSRNTNGTQF